MPVLVIEIGGVVVGGRERDVTPVAVVEQVEQIGDEI